VKILLGLEINANPCQWTSALDEAVMLISTEDQITQYLQVRIKVKNQLTYLVLMPAVSPPSPIAAACIYYKITLKQKNQKPISISITARV
jgi:hypothetical protein